MVTSDFALALTARAHRVVEPLHSMIYFADEGIEEYAAIGLRPGRMPYFASRSAAMGAVGGGVTAATFYNFNPAVIARHIPRAWTLASPEQVLAARLRTADRALRRLLGAAIGSDEVCELAELTREATAPLAPEARPLFAGHADLPWPQEPHLVLWHAVTLLREYRGDGHLLALLQAGLTGLEAIVSHTATGRGFTIEAAKSLRGWSDDQWDEAAASLCARGVLDADGLTAAGVALRAQLEEQTDALDVAAWRHLGEKRTARVIELGRALSLRLVRNNAFPAQIFSATS